MSSNTSKNSHSAAPDGDAANDELTQPRVTAGQSERPQNDGGTETQEAVRYLLDQVQLWLEWQSRMISGVVRSVVYLCDETDKKQWMSATRWPDTSVNTPLLSELSTEALALGKPISRLNTADSTGLVDIIVHPLNQSLVPTGAVCFVLTTRSDSQREAVSQLLQWCTVWLENILDAPEPAMDQMQQSTIEAVGKVSIDAPLAVSANQLCSFLASRFSCSLVAFGKNSGLSTSIVAISHQLDFDRRTNRINEIEFAMDECHEQSERIVLPVHSARAGPIVRAHTQLRGPGTERGVCSIPLLTNGDQTGVLTFIKNAETRFTRSELTQLERIGDAVGPLLILQEMANQSAWARCRRRGTALLQRLVGPGFIRLKTLTAAALVIPLLLAVIPAHYRVSATVSLEGTTQQAVVAPVSGYISSVSARAGDPVVAGQSLVELDKSELEIQREKWVNEKDKLEKEYHLAWANRDKASVSIVASQLAQSTAQLELVENNILHTSITAPFAGMLISGDLNELIGTPVERGQTLFEVVPLDGYKAILHIDEYDVGKLVDGQKGTLRLTGLPATSIDFEVTKAFPVAVAFKGKNIFRVEALLQNPPVNLRPGMQGVAKVIVGSGNLLGTWTQALRERLRMRLWYFGF